MRAKLGTALAVLEKVAQIIAIAVPAVRGIASIAGVSLTETK